MGATPKFDGFRVAVAPTAPIACGDVVLVGNLLGVATSAIPADSVGYIQVAPGEYDVDVSNVTADAGETITVAAKRLDGSEVNVAFGPTIAPVASGDSVARVRLVADKIGASLVGALDSTGGTASTTDAIVAPASSTYTAAELTANFATLAAKLNAVVSALGGTVPTGD